MSEPSEEDTRRAKHFCNAHARTTKGVWELPALEQLEDLLAAVRAAGHAAGAAEFAAVREEEREVIQRECVAAHLEAEAFGRAAGAAEERARVVAMFRGYTALSDDAAILAHPLGQAPSLPVDAVLAEYMAHVIERGEHRE